MAVIYPGIAVPYFSYYQLTENEMYEYFRNNKKKWENFSAEASIKSEMRVQWGCGSHLFHSNGSPQQGQLMLISEHNCIMKASSA